MRPRVTSRNLGVEDSGDPLPDWFLTQGRRMWVTTVRCFGAQVRGAPYPSEDVAKSRTESQVSHALFTPSVNFAGADLVLCRWTGARLPNIPPSTSTSETPCQRGCDVVSRALHGSLPRPKPLVDSYFLGEWSWGESNPRPSAGHRTCYDHSRLRDSRCPTGGSVGHVTSRLGGPRTVFPECQPSFRPPVVFPTVIACFCCRAAGDRPRVALLLTMSLRSPGDQAARVNCFESAILVGAPFSESEQLGSHARPPSPTSKPVSPVGVATGQCTG